MLEWKLWCVFVLLIHVMCSVTLGDFQMKFSLRPASEFLHHRWWLCYFYQRSNRQYFGSLTCGVVCAIQEDCLYFVDEDQTCTVCIAPPGQDIGKGFHATQYSVSEDTVAYEKQEPWDDIPDSTLTVSNGTPWGTWSALDMCPTGSSATAYRAKHEPFYNDGDETSMNAIQLVCSHALTGTEMAQISATEGSFGSWSDWQICPQDYFLVQFRMLVQTPSDSDETAANGVSMVCRGPGLMGSDNTTSLTGPTSQFGDWGDWSSACAIGQTICGLATRVQGPQGSGDDTALNDIQFKCCYVDLV